MLFSHGHTLLLYFLFFSEMSPDGLHTTIYNKIHLHISMEISLFADKGMNSFLSKGNQAVQSKQGFFLKIKVL